jgi:hypothetical protein
MNPDRKEQITQKISQIKDKLAPTAALDDHEEWQATSKMITSAAEQAQADIVLLLKPIACNVHLKADKNRHGLFEGELMFWIEHEEEKINLAARINVIMANRKITAELLDNKNSVIVSEFHISEWTDPEDLREEFTLKLADWIVKKIKNAAKNK